jgi:Putative addiction module component
MTTPVHDLAAEVLDLPAEERTKILELLLASFEPASNAQKAWIGTALRRRADVRAGRVRMVPGDEALTRIQSKMMSAISSTQTLRSSWVVRPSITRNMPAR